MKYRPMCRECWDPVDKLGDELCGWCKLTPEQRATRAAWNYAIFAICALAYLLLFLLP